MKETPVIAQGQMTSALAAMLQKVPRSSPAPRRRKKTSAKRASPKRRTTRRAAPKTRLKKGSAAAKRRMAQLRAMKGKRRR